MNMISKINNGEGYLTNSNIYLNVYGDIQPFSSDILLGIKLAPKSHLRTLRKYPNITFTTLHG